MAFGKDATSGFIGYISTVTLISIPREKQLGGLSAVR